MLQRVSRTCKQTGGGRKMRRKKSAHTRKVVVEWDDRILCRGRRIPTVEIPRTRASVPRASVDADKAKSPSRSRCLSSYLQDFPKGCPF